MWAVFESDEARKALDKAPAEIAAKYEFWKAIVRQSGPVGLRPMKGFHDEALRGEWSGYRSSRLSRQWRVPRTDLGGSCTSAPGWDEDEERGAGVPTPL